MESIGTSCILHHHAQAPSLISSRPSSSQSNRLKMIIKPSNFVCRAQNQPPSDGKKFLRVSVSCRSVGDAGTTCGNSSGDFSPDLLNQGKQEWPELVGEKGEVAIAIIEKENPNVKAQLLVMSETTAIDLSFNFGRVRVFVDDNGVVARVPRVG